MTTQSGFSPQDDTTPAAEPAGPELGLSDILVAWWRARALIVVLALAGGLAAMAIFGAVYMFRPSHQEFTVTFRLLFVGAEKGQYPNGARFTSADIVATPVLEEVYRRNELEKYVKFDDFKAAFAVTDSNPALDRLRRDYTARLEDRRLQPVDRNKIEDEYISKAKAIQNGEFTLVGALGGGFTRWPGSLTAKVMNDILAVWADQSQAQGTFKFNIDVYSDNIVQEAVLKQEDYLVLTDRLRIMIGRISKNLDALASLPGAQLIRVGEHQVSLGELQAALQDSLQFRLTLIQGPIYTFGLFKNRTLAEVYIDENLFRLQLEAQEITSRESALKQALSSYVSSRPGTGRPEDPVPSQGTSSSQLFGGGTVIPQISESFIDRVVNLTTQNTDVAFRQGLAKDAIEIGRKQAEIASERQLYEKMKKALAATDAVSSGSRREEILTNVSQQIDLLIAELKSDLQNVQLLHQEISRRLLQPSMIYSIVMPFYQQRVSVISIRMVGLLAGFAWCVFVGASLVIVAWRAASGAKTSEPLD